MTTHACHEGNGHIAPKYLSGRPAPAMMCHGSLGQSLHEGLHESVLILLKGQTPFNATSNPVKMPRGVALSHTDPGPTSRTLKRNSCRKSGDDPKTHGLVQQTFAERPVPMTWGSLLPHCEHMVLTTFHATRLIILAPAAKLLIAACLTGPPLLLRAWCLLYRCHAEYEIVPTRRACW